MFSPLTTSRWLLAIPLGANLVREQIVLLSLHQRMRSALLTASLPLVLVWALLSLKGHEEEKVPGFLRGARWRASSLRLCFATAAVELLSHPWGMGCSEGTAELCRVHIASGSTFRRQKKNVSEEGIQCQLGAEVQSELGGASLLAPLLEGGAVGRDATPL